MQSLIRCLYVDETVRNRVQKNQYNVLYIQKIAFTFKRAELLLPFTTSMPVVLIGTLQIAWIRSGEGLAAAIRRQICEEIVQDACERVTESVPEESRAVAQKSFLAMSTMARAKEYEPSPSLNESHIDDARKNVLKLHKPVYEVCYQAEFHNALNSIYPYSFHKYGFPRKKGQVTRDLISSLRECLLSVESYIEEISFAAQGSIFAGIPFAIYIAFICLLLLGPDSNKGRDWYYDARQKQLKKFLCMAKNY